MALPGLPGSYVGSAYTKGVVGNAFIPEIWMNMLQIARDAKLVAARSAFMFPIAGKKGDRYHVPIIGTPSVQDLIPETPVTLTVVAPGDYVVDVTSHKVTAFGVQNIVEVQSAYNTMSIYTARHGYALARWYDNEILGMRAAVYNVAAQNIFVSSTGLLSGNGTKFDLPGLLAAKTILDVADCPDESRMLLMSWAQHNAAIAQNLFASRDFVANQPVMSGSIGRILNVEFVPTSQIRDNSLTGFRNGDNATPTPSPGVVGSYFMPLQDTVTTLPTVFGGNSRPVQTAVLTEKEWLAALLQYKPGATQSFENLLQTNAVVMNQAYGLRIYRITSVCNIHTTGDLV